jgi:hypothetical protein
MRQNNQKRHSSVKPRKGQMMTENLQALQNASWFVAGKFNEQLPKRLPFQDKIANVVNYIDEDKTVKYEIVQSFNKQKKELNEKYRVSDETIDYAADVGYRAFKSNAGQIATAGVVLALAIGTGGTLAIVAAGTGLTAAVTKLGVDSQVCQSEDEMQNTYDSLMKFKKTILQFCCDLKNPIK